MRYKIPGLIIFDLKNEGGTVIYDVGQKTKYTDDFPLLVQGYARDGLNNEQIAEKLGIGETSFYKYLNLYPKMAKALREGRTPVDVKVENAMLQIALGYDYREEKQEGIFDKDGNMLDITKRTITEKHIPPNFNAGKFWLTNRKPGKWTKDFVNPLESGDVEIEVCDVDDMED